MRIVNAFASCITPEIARSAIIGTGKKPACVIMHPAQVAAIAMLYEAVAVESVKELKSLEDIDAVRHLAKEYQPSTFLGIPIGQDEQCSLSEIAFSDEAGDVFSVITNLAIPLGFEVVR